MGEKPGCLNKRGYSYVNWNTDDPAPHVDNNNWNGVLTLNYRLTRAHMFTFNHVMNVFKRNNTSLLTNERMTDAIAKETRKNISGLSYRFMPSERWNLSAFGKYYKQFIAGPIATSTAQDKYERITNTVSTLGYGAAGTYFILPELQVKLSYEKAYRLPNNEEMFGDEDLETGSINIKPENSDNVNVNLSYSTTFGGKHSLYVEGGWVYRNTKDYIQRTIQSLSGGKYGAAYENHGKVLTKGYNLTVRYGFSRWFSIGGNFTQMDARDNVKTISGGSSQESITYKSRMPNIPYMFAGTDATFYWHNLGREGNLLTVAYDNLYMHSFPLYSEALGKQNAYTVPEWRIEVWLKVYISLVPPEALVPVVGTTHAVDGSLVVGIVVLSFQLRILQADRH